MPNEEDKNEEVIDWRKLLKKKKPKIPEEEIPKERKRFSFGAFIGSFRDFWEEADKKTRIEVVVFSVVVISIVSVLVFYLIQLKMGGPEGPLYAPPAE